MFGIGQIDTHYCEYLLSEMDGSVNVGIDKCINSLQGFDATEARAHLWSVSAPYHRNGDGVENFKPQG